MGLDEKERVAHIKSLLLDSGFNLEDQLEEGYSGITIHSSGILIMSNQALSDILGYSMDELSGMNAWRLFSSKSASIVREKIAAKSEEPYQAIGRKKSGEEFPIELKGKYIGFEGEQLRIVLIRSL